MSKHDRAADLLVHVTDFIGNGKDAIAALNAAWRAAEQGVLALKDIREQLWAQAAAELRATTSPAEVAAVIERFERRSRGEE